MSSSRPKLDGACYCRHGHVPRCRPNSVCALICHCTDCQRATGSAFKPFGGIAAGKLEVTAGSAAVRRLGDELTHNAFCGQCGSLLYSLVRNGRYVHVTYGTLLDPPTRTPSAHIFVRSKAAWHVIGDGVAPVSGFSE